MKGVLPENIFVSQGHAPLKNPGGVNVVIDVIRAFTTCHVALLRGVECIQLVSTEDEGFRQRDITPSAILAGEDAGLPINGFDFCNSPSELLASDIKGRVLILKTSNGVRSTLNAMDADRVFVSGFCNAVALASYLRETVKIEQQVQLIASHPTGEDDLICANVIRKGLVECLTDADLNVAREGIGTSSLAMKMLDPNNTDYNSEDIIHCCEIPKTQLIIEAISRNGHVYLHEVKRYEK